MLAPWRTGGDLVSLYVLGLHHHCPITGAQYILIIGRKGGNVTMETWKGAVQSQGPEKVLPEKSLNEEKVLEVSF